VYQEDQSMKITAATAEPVKSTRDTTNTNVHLQIMKQNKSKNIRLDTTIRAIFISVNNYRSL
jgi:hypothetical protein